MSAATPANTGAAVDRDNPWPGLASFTEEQRGFFHGRDEEIRALARLMERKALTILFGQSGLGKSSLLQAGVFPRLRAASFCPIYIRLDHGEGAPSPAEQVKTMVAVATARVGTWTKPGAAKPGESLWEFFHHRDDRLVDASGRTIVPVLVFDQFEELFTLGAAAGAQRDRAVAFMSELAELVENRPSEKLVERLDQSSDEMDAFDFSRTDYRVCISLREDYLPHLEGLKTIMPALMENRMRLTRMAGTQALDAVLKPGGSLVTAEVARAIVEFVSGARGGSVERLAELDVEPPLLSVICRELNERRRALGQAQITADLVTGNRREILTDFYERSVADLPEAMRRFVEDKLLTKSGFRDNLALETALEEPGVTRPLIDTLVSRRLLRVEDRIGTQRVELTHDVLADVVRASRDARQQRLLLQEAQERERQAVAAERRKSRRMRFVIGGLVAAVAALCVGAVFGLRAQKRSAAQASQTDLVLGSRFLDEGKLGEGLAYLVSAGRKDPRNELVPARLLTTLTAHNFCLPVGSPLPLPTTTLGALFSADGRWLAVQGDDDVVRIIDVQEWRISRTLQTPAKIRRGGVRWAARNPSMLAAMLVDGSFIVLDVTSGQPRGPAISFAATATGGAANFALSPDGSWAAVGLRGQAFIFNTTTGEQTATLPNHRSVYARLNFSADSQRVVTTYGEDNATQMWSVSDGSPVGAAIVPAEASRGHYQAIFTADGRALSILNSLGARLFDATTGAPLGPQVPVPVNTVKQVEDFTVSPDGSKAAINRGEGLAVFDLQAGKPLFDLLPHDAPVQAYAFSADGKLLFTNSVDGLFRLWSMETGQLVAEPTFQQEQFTPAALAPDGRTVVVFSSSRLAFRLRLGPGPAAPLVLPRHPEKTLMVNFDRTSGAKLLWISPTGAKAIDVASGRETSGGFSFPSTATSVAVSTYGASLMGPGQTFIGRVRDESTGRVALRAWTLDEKWGLREVPLADAPTSGSTAMNPKARYFANAAPSRDAISVWDLRSGELVASFKWSGPRVLLGTTTMTISPDEQRMGFLDQDGVVHVCQILGSEELFQLSLGGRATLNAVRFSLDGRHILTGDDWGAVQLWDAATGALVRSVQAHRFSVGRFDFSPDGKYYASLSNDGSVQIWEANTHEKIGPPLVQKGAPSRVAFSPDNRRTISPSLGGTARVWDINTGLPLTGPLSHGDEAVSTVAFTPDGRFVNTQAAETRSTRVNAPAAGMQVQRLWPAPPTAAGAATPDWLLRLAAVCAGRQLIELGKFTGVENEFARFEDLRREIAALPADAPYAEWGRWLISGDGRPIAPHFTITPAEAKKLREEFSQSPSAPPAAP